MNFVGGHEEVGYRACQAKTIIDSTSSGNETCVELGQRRPRQQRSSAHNRKGQSGIGHQIEAYSTSHITATDLQNYRQLPALSVVAPRTHLHRDGRALGEASKYRRDSISR